MMMAKKRTKIGCAPNIMMGANLPSPQREGVASDVYARAWWRA